MEVGEFDETHFSWKRIRDNVCLRQPATIENIHQFIVPEGHTLVLDAVRTMRADSSVIETNIHDPADRSLIVDGIRKIIELSEPLAKSGGLSGWRQHPQLLKTVSSVTFRAAKQRHSGIESAIGGQ